MAGTTKVTKSGIANVDAMLEGVKWSATSLSYSFPGAAADYGYDYTRKEEPFGGFETLNAQQRAAARESFAQLSSFTSLTFFEVGGGAGDFRFGMTDRTATAHSYYPSTAGRGGDVWFNGGGRYDQPVRGDYAHMTFLHELGHSMGLKHPHEYPAMSLDRDTMEFTVMSYKSYVGDNADRYMNETGGFAQTYMMYDIAALQHLYGVNWTFNGGDSVYSWDPLTGAMSVNGTAGATPVSNRVFMTLWDGGGADTYDLSNYANGVTIDLRPGEWTITSQVQLAHLGQGNYARGNVANALQVQGSVRSLIENAHGGAGDDRLVGNEAANVLEGGGGRDLLIGGAGGDTFRFRSAAESAPGGRDTIIDWERGDRIDVSGLADSLFVGTAAFSGRAGELRYAAAGGSTLVELDLDGDRVADFQLELTGTHALREADFGTAPAGGKIEGQVLDGTDDDDALTGGAGDDLLIGRRGDDILSGGEGVDTASYAEQVVSIKVQLTSTRVQNTGAGRDTLTGIENLIGGSGFDTLGGDSGTNILDGGAGGDQLSGLGGDDVLIGGLGLDRLTGGAGADIFRFMSIEDSRAGSRDRIMDFQSGSDRIDLSAIDARSGGGDDGFAFIGAAAFSGVTGELRYVRSGSMTLLEGDVNGDRVADFQIELNGKIVPLASDFIF